VIRFETVEYGNHNEMNAEEWSEIGSEPFTLKWLKPIRFGTVEFNNFPNSWLMK
jgi:hypothetical protein